MLFFDPLLDPSLQEDAALLHGDGETPGEAQQAAEHEAHRATLTVPAALGLQRGVSQHPVKPNRHLPLPLPGRVTPEAALLLYAARSGLAKPPPAWHRVNRFPEIQLYFIHCFIIICQLRGLEHIC